MKRILLILFLCICVRVDAQLLPDDEPKFGDSVDWSKSLAKGLVYWSPFVEAGNLIDFSINQYSGTILGPTWTAGQTLDFSNSVNDEVVLVNSKGIDFSGDFTIIIDIKRITSTAQNFLKQQDSTAGKWFELVIALNAIRATFDDGVVKFDKTFITPIPIQTFVNIAIVKDAAGYSLYNNGVFSETKAGNGDVDGNFDIKLGTGGATIGTAFTGEIGGLIIYDRSFSGPEIQSLYRNPNQLIATTPIWMFLATEAPPEDALGSIFKGNIFYIPIFGGSILK